MNNKIKLRTPGYYKNFHCISSECKDNCCVGGWQIDIDEETAEYYSTVNGDFGKKLRDNIDYDNLCFRLKDGKWPSSTAFWTIQSIFSPLGSPWYKITDRDGSFSHWCLSIIVRAASSGESR